MSFSGEVKRELCKITEPSRDCRRVLLHGMLYGAHDQNLNKLKPTAENKSVFELFKKLSEEFAPINKSEKIKVKVPAGGDRQTGLFLRGVFLSCGSVSSPDKNYHLELRIGEHGKLCELFTLITESGIVIKTTDKNSRLYIKESEIITDFLTYIGAGVNSMEIMNAKILKELRNNINRSVNCEAANIEKTTRASTKQIADIELIYAKKGKKFLPPELRQVADLRLANFELTLKEIGEECEPPLSRSGVFHRLQKIGKIADKLRII